MEKDKPRGLRPPLDPRGNVLEEVGRALCLRFRNRFYDAIKSRMACARRTASMRSACCAPKARLQHRRRKCPWGAGAMEDRTTFATTQLPTINQVGYSLSSNNSSALRAVQLSPAEAVLSAMKLPKKGGAWLSGEAA